MPSAGPLHRLVVGAVAAVTFLVLAAGALAWRVAGASAAATSSSAAVAAELPPPPTTTSTSTSTPTSTTVKPKPVTTTASPRPAATAPRRVAPATTPPTAAPAPPPPAAPAAPPSDAVAERCAAALQSVAGKGLTLPAGWGFRCPGSAVVQGVTRWGMACWNCEGDGKSWIAVDIGRIGSSDSSLRYVIAHEICHAIDYVTVGATSELGADLCAGLHGAGR